jgi:spore germination cell wall hydrolase CwlJ-like protein
MAPPPEMLDERAIAGSFRPVTQGRHAHLVLVLAALGLILLIANGRFGWTASVPGSSSAPINAASPAVIDEPFAPKALRPLSPQEAEAWNSRIPQVAQVRPATPIVVGMGNPEAFSRSLQCMTQAIYYEAGNEPADGQRAVAQVILNRVRSPIYPHSVCGVVYQGSDRKTGCQFTFTCDGALARVPAAAGWARAAGIAAAALSGSVYAPAGWATNYHADYVVPYWAQSLVKLTTVGRHIFYGWKGIGGTGAAFTSRYSGIEPEPAGMALNAQAEVAASANPNAEIVAVTQAERPLIRFGQAEVDKATGLTDAGKTPGTSPPTVGLGSRWIIGGPGKPPEAKPSSDARALPAVQPNSAAAPPASDNSDAAAKQALPSKP